jgi:ATP-binding cassette subfamily G (WHITE) protein 2 (SNQ2)
MKAYFCAIAAWFSDPTPAQSAAGVTLLALTLYTGYNSEAYMIGTLRWITYINVCIDYHVHYVVQLKFFFFFQPLKDAYELIMTNEFKILDLECSNLVPQGPGYENITLENQVCTVVGSISGQTTVNGLRYLELSSASTATGVTCGG